MLALIWGAVRSRRAQVLTVLVLTALAAAVAAAGPWFATAAGTRAAATDVASAPAGERTLSVRKIVDTQGDAQPTLEQFGRTASGLLKLPTSSPVNGMVAPMSASRGGETPTMAAAYRDDFCAHLLLDGPCPRRDFETTVSAGAAQQLNLAPGGELVLRNTPTTEPIKLHIVSTYALKDPAGAYWSNPLFTANGGLDPAFTPIGTFRVRQLWNPTVTFDVQVPDRLLRGDDGYDLAGVLRVADNELGLASLRLVNSSGPLLDTIERDRAGITRGVLVAMVQVLVLAWFAIGLAGRYTGRDRHGDAALLKLRGSSRGAMLRLAWGQHLVPLVIGSLLGLPLGYLLARALAGPVTRAADRQTALALSVGAVALVLLGGLAVLAVIEAATLRRPVGDLLRQVGTSRGDWRSGLADLLLLAIAVAAVYQARAAGGGTGLALAAPALVALAVALLLARLIGRIADRGGGAAVRTGHLRVGLTAVQVSRQPGADRVFALIVVAVAVFATAAGSYAGERAARSDRSGAELGAARVLTVQAPNRTALLTAVRRADPKGDEAMAVVVDTTSQPPVLAVDSGRLAAVARWRPEFGPAGATAAATARGDLPPAPPAITGTGLTVRVRYDGTATATLALMLQHEATGAPVPVRFGVLGRGERTLAAPVDGCAEPPGCRIVRWELAGPIGHDGKPEALPAGAEAVVRGLDQTGPAATVLDAAALGDIARWRPGTEPAALDLAATGGALHLTVDANRAGIAAYPVDTELPLPVVLAGPAPATWQFGAPVLHSFGATPTPVRVAGTVTALPVLGRAGILTDLESTRRIIGDATPAGDFQVWLAPGAGPGIVAALTDAGLRISGDETAGDRAARLADQAPAVTTGFALIAGAVGLLLAAAAIAVAGAVDRRTRLEHLTALRRQGLSGRVAVFTAYAGIASLVLIGLLGGLVAAALAQPLARVAVPAFTDGWDVLPPPGALGPLALTVAGLIALVVLGLTGWLAVRPLAREIAR